jgi:photosystem II stability/assembly factor-like uncharacterized protein
MSKTAFFCLWLCCGLLTAAAQSKYTIKVLAKGPVKSIRGMSVISDRTIWVSGTGGMVGRSTDGGRQWQWTQVPGCDSCDWRDIAAFSEQEALVLNAGAPAHIFRTTDGGRSWRRVYFNNTPGIFFDGMDFRPDGSGIAIGDPLNGRFTLIHTTDGGRHWDTLPGPPAETGEALFAASGSGIVALPGGDVYFATGGNVSRFFKRQQNEWRSYPLPLIQGKASTGAFSVAFLNAQTGVAVGGDYLSDTLRRQNCLITANGGQTWTPPAVPPYGYRSCVVWMPAGELIATGPSGTDLSADGGRHWQNISPEGFHVAGRARNGKIVFLAGGEGKIGQIKSAP